MIAREKIDFVKKNVVLNPEDRNIKMLQNPEGNPSGFLYHTILCSKRTISHNALFTMHNITHNIKRNNVKML